jgi:hypothetical protein
MLFWYWFTVFLNITASAWVFANMSFMSKGQLEWMERIPLGMISAMLAIFSAFQLGTVPSQEWYKLMPPGEIMVSFMAGIYVLSGFCRHMKVMVTKH